MTKSLEPHSLSLQAERRNRDRFPEDFLFELTEKEIALLVSQNVIPN